MKLTGPRPGVRFELEPDQLRAVVCGIFPPEDAPVFRSVARQAANQREPAVRAAFEQSVRDMVHRLVHGDPTSRRPVGILQYDRGKR